MQEFELRAEIPAPAERVWEVIADHRGWAEWSGAGEVALRHEGEPAPNGLGAIRVIRMGGVAIEEEITRFDPPKRMEYRLTAGLPIRDHSGEITLEPCGAGTSVVWRVRFRPRVPGSGRLLRALLRRAIRDVLGRLKAFVG